MDFKKHYRRRMKRLKQSFIKPLEQSRAVKKMWKLMGTQGMIFHMAHQGRWNVWLAFGLSLLLLVAVLGGAAVADSFGFPAWAWLLIMPVIIAATFVHYALWRATAHVRSKVVLIVLRAYAIPMLALMFFLVTAVVVVWMKEALEIVTNSLQAVVAAEASK